MLVALLYTLRLQTISRTPSCRQLCISPYVVMDSCILSYLISLASLIFHLTACRSGIGASPLAVLGGEDCKACFGDIGGNGGTGGGVFARASLLKLLEL